MSNIILLSRVSDRRQALWTRNCILGRPPVSCGSSTSSTVGGQSQFTIDNSGKVGVNNASPTVSLDLSSTSDSVALPVGTTAQRPSTAYGGYIRWNSTSSALEVYNGTNWVEIISDYFPSGSTTLG